MLNIFRFLALGLFAVARCLAIEPEAIAIPTGQSITPTAAAGSVFQDLNPGQMSAPQLRAEQAATLAVSPDGQTLAILTSGFNLYYGGDGKAVPELSTEYVFLFDISKHEPRQIQVLPLATTFEGLAWSPTSDRFFVSTGAGDSIVEFVRNDVTFTIGRTMPLGHKTCLGISESVGYWGANRRKCGPVVSGLAVSADGSRLLAANIQNDSVSLIDLVHGLVADERDLRPGIIDLTHHGQPGGSFPRSVVWASSERGYVASERDREVISLHISHDRIKILRRVAVHGQPAALIANRSGSRVYVALDTTSQVEVIDTGRDKVIETLNVTAPESLYAMPEAMGGANTDALALTPDERTLLVSNGGQNSVAVVRLSDRARDHEAAHGGSAGRNHGDGDGDDDDDDDTMEVEHSAVMGLVPTGRYPTGVATSKDGSTWYIINYKSETGPSAPWCPKSHAPSPTCLPENWAGRLSEAETPALSEVYKTVRPLNQLPWALQKAGFLTLPTPNALELARLTRQVAHNNHFDRPERAAADEKLFSFLREHIKHVIYIIKENKTYDELFGDLEVGNGDPRLTFFPERITPNHHSLARNFATLDNFLVTGAGSWTGWDWSVSAQTNDFRERLETLASAATYKPEGGLEGEPGMNRNINMAYATSAERHKYDPDSPEDPDILPGARDIAAPDGPGGAEGKGYLWRAALRRGVSVRNWGFFGGFFTKNSDLPLVRDAYAQKVRVFFPTRPSLMEFSDPYYRSFDPALPDYWRVQEWKREFTQFSQKRSAPQLMLVQLGNDHMGDFARAIDGVNTPDTQVADNDYALGLIVETVANSPFAKDTLIIAIEDDPLGGLDHADAFRSVVLFAGPYVRQHAVVSTRYTTVSVVKTIEEILGLEPIGLNDALADPMGDVFDPTLTTWSYQALVPKVLRSTTLPLPTAPQVCTEFPRGSSSYWARLMEGQDFSVPDRVNVASFTRALWHGLNGDAHYPNAATGKDLRQNRETLLSSFRTPGTNQCN